ncbi:MAG: hypothetical protein WKF94_08985 [Solirubrobacteraceae bacterium]
MASLLDRLVTEIPALSIVRTPVRRKTEPAEVGVRARAALDYLRLIDPAFQHSERLGERAGRLVPAKARRLTATSVGRNRVVRSAMRRTLEVVDRGVPISHGVDDLLRAHRPDVVLVTPLVEIGSPQSEYIRAARALGVPTALPVASWDNLTMKGVIRERPDLLTVWNETQRDEAIELHGVPAENITVTGAVAYDHWFGWRSSASREDFCTRVRLDPGRPYVMYACSSRFVAADEGTHLVEWVKRVRKFGGGLEELQVLVRPHPTVAIGAQDVQRRLRKLEGVVLFPESGADPVDRGSRDDYFDSMFHSAGIVGVNTSAFIEAAIVGRPALTVRTERFRDTQDGLRHFGYLPTTNGGVVQVAQTWDEHAQHLVSALSPNGDVARRSNEFLESFVRPYGLNTPAAPRLVDAAEGLAGLEPPAARTSTPGRAIGRALAIGATAAIRVRIAADRTSKHAAARNARKQVDAGERGKGATVRPPRGSRLKPQRKKGRRGGVKDKVRRGRDEDKARRTVAKAERTTAKAVHSTAKRARAVEAAAIRAENLTVQDQIEGAGPAARRAAPRAQEAAPEKPVEREKAVKRAKAVKPAKAVEPKKAVDPLSHRELDAEVGWLTERLSLLSQRDRPVVFAPCLGDMGFELLWWAPMVRWSLRRFPEIAGRSVALTGSPDADWVSDALATVDVGALGLELPLATGRERQAPGGFDKALLKVMKERLEVEHVDLVHPALFGSARRRLLDADRDAFLALLHREDDRLEGHAVVHRASATGNTERRPGDHVVVAPSSTAAFESGALDDDLAVALVLALAEHGPVVLADGSQTVAQQREIKKLKGKVIEVTGLDGTLDALRSARAYVGAYDGRAVRATLNGVPTLAFADDSGRVDPDDHALVLRLSELADGIAPLHALSPGQLPADTVRRTGLDLRALGVERAAD